MGLSRSQKGQTNPPPYCPSRDEILDAIQTLFEDEVQPCVRVLLKRCRERAADKLAEARGLPPNSVDPNETPRIDSNVLRRACLHSLGLALEVKDGAEYFALPEGADRTFVDVCNPDDDYSSQMWEDFAAYLSELDVEGLGMPTGRYECARVLVQQNLPFFQGFSLGRLCHVVYIAVTNRRLLGYAKGAIVPHKYCDAVVKETRAQQLTPMGSGNRAPQQGDGISSRWATWDDLVPKLVILLGKEKNGISISNVKPYFLTEFEIELSETALGHKRLQDVLLDPRVTEKCILVKDAHGSLRAALRPEVWAEEQKRIRAEKASAVKSASSTALPPPGNWSRSPPGVFALPPAPGQWNKQQTQHQVVATMPVLNLAAIADPAFQEGPLLSPGASPRTPPHQVAVVDEEDEEEEEVIQHSESLVLPSLKKLCDKDCDESYTTASEASEDSTDSGYLSFSTCTGDSAAGFAIEMSDFSDVAVGELSIKNTFISFSFALDEPDSTDDMSPTRRRACSVPRTARVV